MTVPPSTNTKIVDKNGKLIAFLSIILLKPRYDRYGDLKGLIPAEIMDKASKLLLSSTSTSESARSFSDGIEALEDDMSTEKSCLSRVA